MNEELTREVLEAMKKCKLDCTTCGGNAVCGKYDWQDTIQTLATALLEERAKPKVWGGAPDNAFRSIVNWYDKSRGFIKSKVFTRELPKTRARIIAEEEGQGLAKKNGWSVAAGALVANVVEAALNKYAEELTKKETN